MEEMMLGEVVDYCIEYENQSAEAEERAQRPKRRLGTQAEFDAIFG